MIKKINFKFAVNSMITISMVLTIFHFLVLLKIIPYDVVWGGKIENISQMYIFELIASFINIFTLLIFAIKGKYIRPLISTKIVNIVLWFFIILLALNTIGNLLAESTIETLLFTPLTLIGMVFCYRIVIENNQ